MLHDRPVCYRCNGTIHTGWVFAAPCNHPHCPSAAFHGLCLMEWREHRETRDRELTKWLAAHDVRLFVQIERKDDRTP